MRKDSSCTDSSTHRIFVTPDNIESIITNCIKNQNPKKSKGLIFQVHRKVRSHLEEALIKQDLQILSIHNHINGRKKDHLYSAHLFDSLQDDNHKKGNIELPLTQLRKAGIHIIINKSVHIVDISQVLTTKSTMLKKEALKPRYQRGKFSVITGPPNTGKSVQARMFCRYKLSSESSYMRLKYPIYPSPSGQKINKILHSGEEMFGKQQEDFQKMYIQNRKEFQPTLIWLLNNFSQLSVIAEDYSETSMAWGTAREQDLYTQWLNSSDKGALSIIQWIKKHFPRETVIESINRYVKANSVIIIPDITIVVSGQRIKPKDLDKDHINEQFDEKGDFVWLLVDYIYKIIADTLEHAVYVSNIDDNQELRTPGQQGNLILIL